MRVCQVCNAFARTVRHPAAGRTLVGMHKLWLVVAAVALSACTAMGADPDAVDDDAGDGDVVDEEAQGPEPLRVAGGPDPESALLAEVMVGLLEGAGLPAESVRYPSARATRQALKDGDVDVRTGYTGETWLESLGRADPPGDVQASFREVSEHDDAEVVWMRPRFLEGIDQPPANATFTFVVAGPPSLDAQLTTVSQLATRLSERADATLCVDHEFASRPDGLRAVLAAYSVRSDQPVLAASPDEVVGAVLAGDCLAGLTTATDGRAWASGLRPLVDDLGVFPAFVVVPQVSRAAVEEHPEIRAALGPLASHLSTQLLGGWNARVAAGEPIEQVAEDAVSTLSELADRPSADDG